MGRYDDVKTWFYEETGIRAIRVSQIFFGTYMVEAEDGHTYKVEWEDWT